MKKITWSIRGGAKKRSRREKYRNNSLEDSEHVGICTQVLSPVYSCGEVVDSLEYIK